MEAAAKKGLEIDSASSALQDLLKQAQIETKESPEAQAHMHQLRQDKKKDAQLQNLTKCPTELRRWLEAKLWHCVDVFCCVIIVNLLALIVCFASVFSLIMN